MTDAGYADRALPQKADNARPKANLAVSESAQARQRRGATVSSNVTARREAAAIRARRWAKPSAAGEFSPVAPAALGIDEYASITMSAGTHLRGIAPAHSTPRNTAAINTDSSEWTKHLAQRRVTEVPEQFAK